MSKENEIYSRFEVLARMVIIEATRCSREEWAAKMDYLRQTYCEQKVVDHVNNRQGGALKYKWAISNMQLTSSRNNIEYGSQHVDERPVWLEARLRDVENIKMFN